MPLYQCNPATYAGFLSYFNTNSHNGVLGSNELRAALVRAGANPSNQEIQQMIGLISVDPTGISWQCFIDYVSSYTKFRDQEAEYAEAFRIYDISGNGVLTRDDIKYCMEKIGIRVDLDQLMDSVDTNHDGNIDYDEFCAMMKKTVF
ncbi:calmodulin-like protein [Mercenaria mercenaria]|uniref:calmodulin-like protein n=1 Tax=Mercenaria mercenaria TaxID=6596 RepID=UPI00234E47B4|nr:calmodulin-like protein [Mercenaria mercenaria]